MRRATIRMWISSTSSRPMAPRSGPRSLPSRASRAPAMARPTIRTRPAPTGTSSTSSRCRHPASTRSTRSAATRTAVADPGAPRPAACEVGRNFGPENFGEVVVPDCRETTECLCGGRSHMSILGTRVVRTEDPRLLTVGGTYVDDLRVPELDGAARVTFVRSPIAHALITGIDADLARQAPGVIAVLVAADIDDLPPPPPD